MLRSHHAARLHAAIQPRLYCLKTHIWLQPCAMEPLQSAEKRLRIGLTERALEDIGDIGAVNPLVCTGGLVQRGQPLMQIDWTAISISDGDELYHTRFGNIEGTHTVKSPVAGALCEVNPTLEACALDSWLVELYLAPHADLNDINYGLIDEASYLKQCGAGAFGEANQELSYTSYG